MRKIFSATMTVGLLAMGALGCRQSGGTDIAGAVCQKAGGCDSLSGITADQCKNVVNNSLQSMTSAGRSEAENALNGCLAMTDCTGFSTCINTVLAGGSATGGSTGSGGTMNGTGGSALGGSGGSAPSGSGGSTSGGSSGSGGLPGTGGGPGSGGSALGGSGGSALGGSGGSASGGSSGSAGQPGTGGGSGGASAAPELMTSGPGAYWMSGQVTKVTTGTAGLVVDQNTKYQRFDGFGGAFNEMGWDALSVLPADQVTNAMKLLFDAQAGAKFVYGRVPIGASDYAMSWYTLDDTAGDYSMSKFSISRDQQKLIPYIKAALQVRSDLHLWAQPLDPAQLDGGQQLEHEE